MYKITSRLFKSCLSMLMTEVAYEPASNFPKDYPIKSTHEILIQTVIMLSEFYSGSDPQPITKFSPDLSTLCTIYDTKKNSFHCLWLAVTFVIAWSGCYWLDDDVMYVFTKLWIWEIWTGCNKLKIIWHNDSLVWQGQSRNMANWLQSLSFYSVSIATSHIKRLPNPSSITLASRVCETKVRNYKSHRHRVFSCLIHLGQ
jgi:hypothetical protein